MEPLGTGQVVRYLERLAGRFEFHLVSFEKQNDLRSERRASAMAARLSETGLVWYPLVYHKKPAIASTAFDIARGVALGRHIIRNGGVRVIHARSYVPGLMAHLLKRLTGTPFILDTRGFWFDEKVDAGLWREWGAPFRFGKAYEARLWRAAAHIVTLTRRSADEIEERLRTESCRVPISVIPTCVDLSLFRPKDGKDQAAFTVGYAGSIGGRYDFGLVLAFFQAIRRICPEAKLLVINRGQHQPIEDAIARAGLPSDSCRVRASEPDGVLEHLVGMNLGLAFYRHGRSVAATAPTKLAEYLAAGVPCLVSAGLDDATAILERHRVGFAVGDGEDWMLDCAAVRALALAADPGLRDRCIATAAQYFSLENGASQYREIYDAFAEIAV